jgi:hypothetical protein
MPYEKKSKKKNSGAVAQPATDNKDWEREYETQRDLDAVVRHHAVHKDPERLKAVHSLAAKKLEENKGKKAEAEHAIKLGKKG